MSKPTAKELLDNKSPEDSLSMIELSARVEKVLAACEGAYYEVSVPKEKILRILNGESE